MNKISYWDDGGGGKTNGKTAYQKKKELKYLQGGEEAVRRFLAGEALRASIARLSMTDEQRSVYNEKSRIRQAKYR